MIFFLSLRNIIRHKKHSLQIFLIFFVILFLFCLGNSILWESRWMLKLRFVNNLTGDLAVTAPSSQPVSLFGNETPSIGEYSPLLPLTNVDKLREFLENQPEVAAVTGLITGAAVLDLAGARQTVPLFGIEGPGYFKAFPGITVDEGAALGTHEPGVLISRNRAGRIERETGKTLKIGDPVKLSLYGKNGFKIRQLPLTGIFHYSQPDPVLDELVFSDLQTLRALNSLSLAVPDNLQVTAEDSSLLDSNQDDLFGDDFFSPPIEPYGSGSSAGISPEDVTGITAADSGTWEGGGWHFLLIKLKPGARSRFLVSRFESFLEDTGLPAEILDWKEAAGLSVRLSLLLQLFFNMGFGMVAFTGCVGLINILLVSIIERTGEIGTLRALGAEKSWIIRLFLTETLLLSFFGGGVGVAAAYLTLKYINSIKLVLSNNLVRNLIGGELFFIQPTFFWAGITILTGLLLAAAASVFPLGKALSILPSTAQNRG